MTLRLDVVQLHVHSFESGGALGGARCISSWMM